MKLVELLARELSEWPENVVVYFQWGNGEVFATSKGIPTEYKGIMWYVAGPDIEMAYDAPMYDKMLDLSDDHDTARVNKEQWQAERERQNGGEWKRHRGGDKPKSVSDGEMVEVRLRCGDTQTAYADKFLWNHADCDESVHITKYRVISQPQAEEVEMIKVDPVVAANVEALNGRWQIGRVDGPLVWRDTVIELDAYIEGFTRERESLINRLTEEGFALLPAMTPVMWAADVDMGDWRNWKAGDIVEVIIPNDGELPVGGQYTVAEVEHPEYVGGMMVKVFDDEGENHWAEDDQYEGRMVFKFVRRP